MVQRRRLHEVHATLLPSVPEPHADALVCLPLLASCSRCPPSPHPLPNELSKWSLRALLCCHHADSEPRPCTNVFSYASQHGVHRGALHFEHHTALTLSQAYLLQALKPLGLHSSCWIMGCNRVSLLYLRRFLNPRPWPQGQAYLCINLALLYAGTMACMLRRASRLRMCGPCSSESCSHRLLV